HEDVRLSGSTKFGSAPRTTATRSRSSSPARPSRPETIAARQVPEGDGAQSREVGADAAGLGAAAAAQSPAPFVSPDDVRTQSGDRQQASEPYGPDDPGVSPPAMVEPGLVGVLSTSSPNVRLDALTIAVVVRADGTVESVRGVNAPQTMGEAVLL